MPEKIKKGHPEQAKKTHGLTIAQGKKAAQVSRRAIDISA
jgi:hypothetical protein